MFRLRRPSGGKSTSIIAFLTRSSGFGFFLLISVLVCVLGICGSVDALENDASQPLRVTADVSSFNYRTRTGLYEGHVQMIQGSARLRADRVEIRNNIHHKMEVAIASGRSHHPAEYWSQLKPGDAMMHASARSIWFYPAKSLVVLKGNAIVTHGKNIFRGPVLTWNIKDRVAVAPSTKAQKAIIVIHPDGIAS